VGGNAWHGNHSFELNHTIGDSFRIDLLQERVEQNVYRKVHRRNIDRWLDVCVQRMLPAAQAALAIIEIKTAAPLDDFMIESFGK